MRHNVHLPTSLTLRAMKLVLLLLSLPLIAGAAPDRPLPASWTDVVLSEHPDDKALVKQLRPLNWYDACRQWGNGTRTKVISRRTKALRLLLEYDELLTSEDTRHVPAGRVDIGMSTCGVLAVFGLPDKFKTTTTAATTSAQLVYGARGIYVYTEAKKDEANGVVRSIQR